MEGKERLSEFDVAVEQALPKSRSIAEVSRRSKRDSLVAWLCDDVHDFQWIWLPCPRWKKSLYAEAGRG